MSLFCPECHASYADESMRLCPVDGTRLYRVDDDDPLIGTVIDGRFRVDYTLGVGGMGTVYGGVQLSVNRDVAIKVLRTELATREVALERFFREAKTISKLTHPNIVKLIDFGQDRDRGVLFLVMELVRGTSLGDLLAEGRLRTPLALEVAYQVCGALTEPHAEAVIHRDLKPDNLLLVGVSDGTVQTKVLDFGIARFMESNTQLTGTGMICGTPAYMAPEQAQNETLDARTDLYALGVILYEMLSGWPPFTGTSSLQVMLKHIQEHPPPLRELLPPATLPESIEDLVYSLIAKERALRPKSARGVRDEIDDIRRSLGFEPIRLAQREDFSGWLLPKLPMPNHEKSGPTQVLQRETGLEIGVTPQTNPDDSRPTDVWDKSSSDAPPVTVPLTPDGKMEVQNDALRLKLQTRDGGQQAWTPDGQHAVQAIKDTKDGVDALGATIDSSSLGKPVRKTMVEADDSEAVLGVAPQTGDSIPAAAPRAEQAATVTRERRAASGRSNLVLAVIAVVAGVAVIAAAYFVVQRINQVIAQKPPPQAPLVKAPEPTPPKPIAKSVSTDLLQRRLEAEFTARDAVHDGREQAILAARDAHATAKPSKSGHHVAGKKPHPPREPRPPKTVGDIEQPAHPKVTDSKGDKSGDKPVDKLIDGMNLRKAE